MVNKVLVTGASGYVGARLYFDLQKEGFEALGTYKSNRLSDRFFELDITDRDAVRKIVMELKPDAIVHSAALASSKECSDLERAKKINIEGTANIVDAANSFGSQVIYISGTVASPEGNGYEKTKFGGEVEVRKSVTGRYVILRPSVIYGMSPNTTTDKPFNQILRDSKIEHDSSWMFSPTSLEHLSSVVKWAIEKNINGLETPVVVPEMKSKFEIANDILARLGESAKSRNDKVVRPENSYDMTAAVKLGMPTMSYRRMIDGIADEIMSREKFVLEQKGSKRPRLKSV